MPKRNRRGERVGYGLERAQRILEGLDDDKMEFSEQSLARALDRIIDEADPDDGGVLGAMADALDNSGSEWKLTLTRRKRGRFVPPNETSKRFYTDMAIFAHVELATEDGVKREAAVQEQADAFEISRAAVFAALKRAKECCETSDSIGRVLPRDGPSMRDRCVNGLRSALSQAKGTKG